VLGVGGQNPRFSSVNIVLVTFFKKLLAAPLVVDKVGLTPIGWGLATPKKSEIAQDFWLLWGCSADSPG
jgi:hypothetical protein